MKKRLMVLVFGPALAHGTLTAPAEDDRTYSDVGPVIAGTKTRGAAQQPQVGR